MNKSVKFPKSIRSFERGEDGTYRSGKSMIGKGLPTEVEVASTAIAEIRRKGDTTAVRFVNGDKFYDFRQTDDEYSDFLNSESKGRYVNYVMKVHNRIGERTWTKNS